MDRIDALRLLLDVAAAGSFSGAARLRGLATSTVAQAVGQLEGESGATLITRSTRKLVFTREGESLLSDARRIVSDWDGAMSLLKDDGTLSGPIRLTATNDFGRSQLRPLLDDFLSRHPALRLSLLLSDSTLDLIAGRIDVAIRTGPLPDSGLHARLLVPGGRVVCASPAYWARAGRPTHPSELSAHNCLVLARPDAPLANWRFMDGDAPVTVKVAGDREASDGGVLREWAVAGRGVILKNRWDVLKELSAGTLETVLDAFSPGPIDLFAVYPSYPPSRRVAALVDFIADALASAPSPA